MADRTVSEVTELQTDQAGMREFTQGGEHERGFPWKPAAGVAAAGGGLGLLILMRRRRKTRERAPLTAAKAIPGRVFKEGLWKPILGAAGALFAVRKVRARRRRLRGLYT